MGAAVLETYAQALALAAAQGGAGDAAGEGPGREHDARRHLHLLVDPDDLPFPRHAAIGIGDKRALIEIDEHLRGIEIVTGMIDGADREVGAVMLMRAQD